MKTILITGCSGFVGQHILNKMSVEDVKIVAIVRPGKDSNLNKQKNIKSIRTSKDIFIESFEWWKEICSGIDIVIHAAWYTEPGKYLLSPLNTDCLKGSINMVQGGVAAGVKKIVGVGTCFEYDLSVGKLSVETPLKPTTPYAAAKASLYIFLEQWLKTVSIDFAWCRLFYLFGNGEDERRLVPYIRRQLENGLYAELTSGNQIRDFINVEVAAKKIVDIALGEMTGPFNICSGTPITIRQIAERIADEYGRRDLLKFGARPDNVTDSPIIVGIPN